MRKYHVIFRMEVDAENPAQAAWRAANRVFEANSEVWTVPDTLDEDPDRTIVTPAQRRWEYEIDE